MSILSYLGFIMLIVPMLVMVFYALFKLHNLLHEIVEERRRKNNPVIIEDPSIVEAEMLAMMQENDRNIVAITITIKEILSKHK